MLGRDWEGREKGRNTPQIPLEARGGQGVGEPPAECEGIGGQAAGVRRASIPLHLHTTLKTVFRWVSLEVFGFTVKVRGKNSMPQGFLMSLLFHSSDFVVRFS